MNMNTVSVVLQVFFICLVIVDGRSLLDMYRTMHRVDFDNELDLKEITLPQVRSAVLKQAPASDSPSFVPVAPPPVPMNSVKSLTRSLGISNSHVVAAVQKTAPGDLPLSKKVSSIINNIRHKQ